LTASGDCGEVADGVVNGEHARLAVGVSSLPAGTALEGEATLAFS
jgi:hypothetical protein